MNIKVKRVYDPLEPSDGDRLLVDRLWPRGLRNNDLHAADWAKYLAPSTELRRRITRSGSHGTSFRRLTGPSLRATRNSHWLSPASQVHKQSHF